MKIINTFQPESTEVFVIRKSEDSKDLSKMVYGIKTSYECFELKLSMDFLISDEFKYIKEEFRCRYPSLKLVIVYTIGCFKKIFTKENVNKMPEIETVTGVDENYVLVKFK